MAPAIEVRDLHKSYPKGVEALRGITFSVEAGEVYALLGPNGAGKSTTVRILTTLTAASSGSAIVAGLDVAREPAKVRSRIGYVAQSSGVDVYATGREARSRSAELLAAFRLDDAADRLVRTYSGGMKRRLDVALGLIHRPEVLFLDEPTTGLDPESRAALWEEVGRLARGGLTILLTTHYLEEADRLARRVGIVDRGQIVASGTPEELKGSLRGDLVRIDLTDRGAVARATAVLAELEGVLSVLDDAGTLCARVEHGARSIPAIVGGLERGGFTIAEVTDVYLQATGHRFPGDEAPAPPGRGGRG